MFLHRLRLGRNFLLRWQHLCFRQLLRRLHCDGHRFRSDRLDDRRLQNRFERRNQPLVLGMGADSDAVIAPFQSPVIVAGADQDAAFFQFLLQLRDFRQIEEEIVCLRADHRDLQPRKRLLQICALLCDQLPALFQIVAVLQRCQPRNLRRNRDAPRLAALCHPLQQGRIAAQAVAQPQAGHRVVLGEGPQNHQVGEGLHPAVHAVLHRLVQKIPEALVHYQQCTAGGAAGQDALQQLLLGQLAGRVVGVAEKDDIGLRLDVLEQLLGQLKAVFRLELEVVDLAPAGSQRLLILRKGWHRNQRRAGTHRPHSPENKVCRAVAAQDVLLAHLLGFCKFLYQFPANRIRIVRKGIHRISQGLLHRLRQAQGIDVG